MTDLPPKGLEKASRIASRIHKVFAEELSPSDPESDAIAEMALASVVAGFIVCGDDKRDISLWEGLMLEFLELTMDLMPAVYELLVNKEPLDAATWRYWLPLVNNERS
jgi:hypothetical protein